MSFWIDLLFLLAVLVGIVGIVVPVLPGTVLILAAVVGWAIMVSEPVGWVVLGVVVLVLGVGTAVKYAVPGRQLKQSGVPTLSIVAGAVLGVVGFFVVPIVGLPLGFVAGIYLSEARRFNWDWNDAWPSTVSALKAVGLSILIELTAGLVAAFALVVGAVLT